MKIAQLSRLLDSLGHGLDGVVAGAVTGDLRSFAGAMEPFGDASVMEFTKFLGEFGQAFKETGTITPQGKIALPKPARTPKAPKPDKAQVIAAAVAAVRDLFKEIDSGLVDATRVDQVLSGIGKLTIPDLNEVLGELQIAERPKSKPKIIAKIKEVVSHQIEAQARAASVGGAAAR